MLLVTEASIRAALRDVGDWERWGDLEHRMKRCTFVMAVRPHPSWDWADGEPHAHGWLMCEFCRGEYIGACVSCDSYRGSPKP